MFIIKIGGGESIDLEAIVADLVSIEEPVVIVHGANTLRDQITQRMGFKKQVITSTSGFSSVFSDQDAIDAILMAYSGLRNKRLVELCQRHGINAVGLTGLDGRLVQGQRNRGIRVEENGKKLLKRDFSGKPREINDQLLRLLLEQGYIPVLTIPIADEDGFAINSENDDIVTALQVALGAHTVIQLIEAPGLLKDKDLPDSLIPRLDRDQLHAQMEQASGRIKRKLYALHKLASVGGTRIIISDGRIKHPLRHALEGGGTRIE